MNIPELPDELFVPRLEGVIEQWSTDTQAEHIRSMAELDAPSSLPNPDDEDDHLREEEDSLDRSVALLQDELARINPETPVLDRAAAGIQDLFKVPWTGDGDNMFDDMSSPLSSTSFLDDSAAWHAEHPIDALQDVNDQLFDELELEFKQLLQGDGSLPSETPVSNTTTDGFEAVTPISDNGSAEAKDHPHATTTTSTRTTAKRVDPTILEGDFRNVIDPQELSEQSITEEYAGLFGLTVEAESVACVRLFECIARPDVQCRQIMHSLYPAFEAQGLVIQESQGSHVVLEFPTNARTTEWHFVDVQICIQRRFRQRVLVCRFLKRLSLLSDPHAQHTMGPQTRIFVEQARHALLGHKLTFSCLYGEDRRSITSLDKQFLTQLEGACRDRMYASFKESITPMEDQARSREWRCARLMSTMEPIYKEHGTPLPEIDSVADIHEYPLDALSILPLETPGQVEDESTLEAVAYVLLLRDRCWHQVQQRCDAELTARIQRFNARILDRVAATQRYQAELLHRVLESRRAQKSSLTANFRRLFEGVRPDDDCPVRFNPEQEIPLYYCSSMTNSGPATFYVTRNFLCSITKITAPFIPKWTKVIPMVSVKYARKYTGSYMALPNTIEIGLESGGTVSEYHFTPAAEATRVIDVIFEVVALTKKEKKKRPSNLASGFASTPSSGYVSFEPLGYFDNQPPLTDGLDDADDIVEV